MKLRISLIDLLAVLMLFQGTVRGEAPLNLQTFELHEHFGVSHPPQIVDFDVSITAEPGKLHVVTDDGNPTVFQFLDGGKKVAVLTDLPAGKTRRWYLRNGAIANLEKTALRVSEEATYFEITNGLTGVRLAKAATVPAFPINKPPYGIAGFDIPCPIQGVLLRDGKWTATGPNRVAMDAKEISTMGVRILEKGPLKVVVEIQYDALADAYRYGGKEIRPAGPGYYRSVVTVQAEQPSILVEEDTDLDIGWSFDVFDGVKPTHGRFRGHVASKKEYGYEPGGQALRQSHERPPMDAQVDLNYSRPKFASYTTNDDLFAVMGAWNPWAMNTGWYWQLFNMEADETANLIGAFVGRPGLALEPGFTGTGVFTKPGGPESGEPRAGFTFLSNRRGPDAVLYRRSRYHWGLFVSTKRDLLPPDRIQPINLQMNLHGGFNLNKISRYTLDFPDPPGGYGALYMDKASVQAIKKRLSADRLGRHGNGYLGFLWNAEPTARPLIEMWTDLRGTKLKEAISQVQTTAREMLNVFVNREGIYGPQFQYWNGGLAMMRHGIWIDEILADPRLSADDRKRVKAAAVLFGNVLWDNDFVPMDNWHGINLGTENMPIQQRGYRDFYALLLASHPTMIDRAKSVEQSALETVRTIVNESGAEIGSPHYVGASFAPTLNTLLQIKQKGFQDPFQAEPKLARFAEFYLNLLTPPEPRAGNRRTLLTLGDGSLEPSELFGVLGTGIRNANPKLSAHLMGAWDANGRPHSGFFGTTVLMIDDTLPKAAPNLGDADFPGYYTVLRHGCGTPNESAIWFVNGDFYRDHRHNDHGTIAIYALGQPLSVNWSGFYSPKTTGAYMHSGVVLEKDLGHAWDQDGCSLDGGGHWRNSTRDMYSSDPEGAYVRAHFESERGETTWTRTITFIRANPSVPVFLIDDTFNGPGDQQPKIQTMNFLAKGRVEWLDRRIAPTERTHPAAEHKSGMELPSADAKLELRTSLNRLGFSGKYPIDWDVYVSGADSREGLIGNWAVRPQSPVVVDKDERQQILRIRGTGSFRTLIVAWPRGKKPRKLAVEEDVSGLVAQVGDHLIRFQRDGYVIESESGPTIQRSYRFASRE